MSAGDLKAFLTKLFASEGGGDPKIINQYGYIGKYQFGEDALTDLGYFKTDGKKHADANGNFFQDWVGTWTGKNGATSREVFLNNVSIQDQAGVDWVRLLCRNGKKYGADKYIGQTINGVLVTESGMIAAAHLKGYGSGKPEDGKWKYKGVLAFLRTGGTVDGADANGTKVSSYMRKFAGFELGCCAPVEAQTSWMYPFPRQGKSDAFDGGVYLGLPMLQEGALGRVDDGFYPVGASGLWHGGIHFDAGSGTVLDQTQGVRCLKDGEVVAYRVDSSYQQIEFPKVQRKALYASSFTLVRHTLKLPEDAKAKFEAADKPAADKAKAPATKDAGAAAAKPAAAAAGSASKAKAPAPATKTAADSKAAAPANSPEPGTELVFYSLYMHLMDFKGYQDDRKRARPAFWAEGSEFVVGEKAKDTQEVPPPPPVLAEPVGEEVIGCDCAGTTGTVAGEADALAMLGWGPGRNGEWENVVQEAHVDD
ncbi:hypothetical protein [Stenotrophomonas sp. 24(2023)]|uniref:hypothetical protein n=1 Tax=Stenotrophomonas sp. 24(2023) TaxID=3068324 RepID=UPI0027E1A832|nr:hypothetical protein [Stenotrophomonas sp. 24(2023)]WMJ69519.1 hypothetical protein Q9R17_20455 [Stenotrophomonas sp. 24(2023)]